MAKDWGSHEQTWKTKYITDSFKISKHKEIQYAKSEFTLKEFQFQFEKNYIKYRDIKHKAVTMHNWTLAVYKEVSVSPDYANDNILMVF